jgi:hypothetical protein
MKRGCAATTHYLFLCEMNLGKISCHILFFFCVIFLLMAGYRNVGAVDNNTEAFPKAEALLQVKKHTGAIVLYEEILTQDPRLCPHTRA